MFQQGTYWREKYEQLYVHHDHTEEMEGHAAVWKTTIGVNKDLQPFVEWFICFRRQPLGALTIRYHDGALRTIMWKRATISLWQLNTLWQEEPPLIDPEIFPLLISDFSTATARYLKRRMVPIKGCAAFLLQVQQ